MRTYLTNRDRLASGAAALAIEPGAIGNAARPDPLADGGEEEQVEGQTQAGAGPNSDPLSGEASRRGPPNFHPLQNDPLLDEREASAYLGGVSCRCLQRWRAANLPPRWIRIGARAVRYRRSALDEFLAAGERQPLERTS